MNADRIPHLAVVGSVNKGKSSLVSTICEMDSVLIDFRPGSTSHAEAFDFRVDPDGPPILRLFDTPGFQNARKAGQWLKDYSAEGHSEIDAVRVFLATFRGTTDFEDEWRLLEPIANDGAGILYVVDGSAPFNPASIAEMEILRMTGRPRMAIINQTSERDFTLELQEKLSPYFKTTVFNTHQATMDDRLALLESFKGIDDSWRDRIERVIQALRDEMDQRKEEVARAIATMLLGQLTWKEKLSTTDKDETDKLREEAEDRYLEGIRRFEQRCRKEIRQSYRHHRVEIVDESVPELNYDITEENTWKLFGLRRSQLMKIGVVAGAAAGGGIDLAVGGASLLVGTLIGAVAGAGLTWFGSQKIAQIKIKKVFKMGGESWEVSIEPSDNPEFPFIMLDRGLTFFQLIAARTHAQREQLTFEPRRIASAFSSDVTRKFAELFKTIRKKRPVPEDVKRKLRELIQENL